MKMERFHWALSALVLGIPIRASAKCGGVNYKLGSGRTGKHARLRGDNDAVCALSALCHSSHSSGHISIADIYQDKRRRRRSDEIHYDVSRRMSVHHWSFYRVSGILRVSDMVGVRFRITVSD